MKHWYNIAILLRRELRSYFTTPLAYIFMIVFLMLSGLFTFYVGNFFLREQADLLPFFSMHPWVYMVFVPAITMRLWSEEYKLGTVEILFTLPITIWQTVLAKFLAAWIFTIFTLMLSFPMWIMVNYLGNPDNGVIVASYVGSILLAGGFLSVGSLISALTNNQVIAFIITLFCCLLLNLAGFPLVNDSLHAIFPNTIVSAISSFSFLKNYEMITKGILEISSLLFFISGITVCLYANNLILEFNKTD